MWRYVELLSLVVSVSCWCLFAVCRLSLSCVSFAGASVCAFPLRSLVPHDLCDVVWPRTLGRGLSGCLLVDSKSVGLRWLAPGVIGAVKALFYRPKSSLLTSTIFVVSDTGAHWRIMDCAYRLDTVSLLSTLFCCYPQDLTDDRVKISV